MSLLDLGKRLIEGLHAQRQLNRLGLAVQRIIRRRTRRGIGVDGERFQDYSDGHTRKREAKGLPTDTVDLTFSLYDGMMQAIDHVIANDYASVALLIDDRRKHQIARYHNIEGAGKSKVIRRFWGLSDEEEGEVFNLFKEDVSVMLEELNLE